MTYIVQYCNIVFIIIIIQELQIRGQFYASKNCSYTQNINGKYFHASCSLFLNKSIEVAFTISFGSSFLVLTVWKKKKL